MSAKAGLEPKSPQPAVITFLLAFKRTIVGPFCSRGYILSLICRTESNRVFVAAQIINVPYLPFDVYGGLPGREERTFVSYADVK